MIRENAEAGSWERLTTVQPKADDFIPHLSRFGARAAVGDRARKVGGDGQKELIFVGPFDDERIAAHGVPVLTG